MAGRKKKENISRAEKSALTRKKIIDTGFKLLKEKGYTKLTVRNICEEAQISTGSFYHFYKTKDDLMSEFLVQEDWQDKMEDSDDIVEYIIFGYMGLISLYETLGIEFTSNFYTASNQVFNIYTRAPGPYTSDLIRTRLLWAREKGMIKEDIPIDKIIYDIQSLVFGNVFQWCVMKGAIDIRLELDRMLRDYLLLRVVTEKYAREYVSVQEAV